MLEHGLPVLGVQHLRVELHPGHAPAQVLEGGHRGAGRAADTSNPSGAADTESPWLIHTDCWSGRPSNSVVCGAVTVSGVRPNSASPVR